MSNTRETRQIFCELMDNLMEKDENVVIIDADLAKANGTMPLRAKYPKRAIDVGIAEQNMASMSAGMSSLGMKAFILSFTPFVSRRICDQIAISISYAKQNVKIIGTDPGITAELNGGTHMSVEDIGVIRSIPDIAILDIIDNNQLISLFPQIVDYDGPMYIRMLRKVPQNVFESGYEGKLFEADILNEGNDISLFAEGICVKTAKEATDILKKDGINVDLLAFHSIKPIDEEAIVNSLKKTGIAVTIENHNVIGGLRSAVAEVSSEKYPVFIKALGICDHFGEVGKIPFLSEKYKMTVNDVVLEVKKMIKKK